MPAIIFGFKFTLQFSGEALQFTAVSTVNTFKENINL